ncbi:FHA domain-containing protein [candidate division KSB3 bacterium]|uniref:FHA domain-containing protein n=1 Tax=candidate division KSB3 bacterium TaxID=2044937 RepID=A0A9D5Q7B1_9BACT|nr:FHA domain-containing protein [candidate division KSB3 bacterium]MBD3326729.1 FHA domain-containing protein [candidate division KSB3 bacterium]
MKFLKNLYIQRALREEAKGNFKQAAAFYSKAEDFEKVGEMHELIGDMLRTFPDKIKAYQRAIRWYQEPEHLERAADKLARAMEIEIRADAKVSPVELHRLPKVAEYYALAKQWKKAGSIYEELGMYDEATQMYIQGGEIRQIEQISARQEARDHRLYSAQQYYDDAEAAYHRGHRDKAHQALQQCLTIEPHHAKARDMLETIHQALEAGPQRLIRIPTDECEYLLFAKPVVTIGRSDEADLTLTQNDVSRTHARIGFHQQQFLVEDLKSSNGTRVNGLRIKRRAELRDRDVLGIGRSLRFEVHLQQSPQGLTVTLCPLEHSRHRRYLLFSGKIRIGGGRDCEIPLRRIAPVSPSSLFTIHYSQPFWYLTPHAEVPGAELNGSPIHQYATLIAGDTVSASGMSLLFE